MTRIYLVLAVLAVAFVAPPPVFAAPGDFPACGRTAGILKKACFFDVKDDFNEAGAFCFNDEEKKDCFLEAREEYREGKQECYDVFAARLDVCVKVGKAPYQPEFGEDFADNFVNPLNIGNGVTPNPYFPLIPGNFWVYEGTFEDDEGEEVTETITVQVTEKTKLIDGVTCIVVVDTAEEDGVAIEITDDWYAQDMQGNVWYCGEISENNETFEGDDPEEPELVDIDGSWKHGREGGKAGILMPFVPNVGDTIRQEVAWGDAEDVIEILRLDADESVTLADESVLPCANACLETLDYTPLEPDAIEHKFFLPNVGQILEVDPEEDVRVELKEYGNNL